MNKEKIIKSTQEQAIAAWNDFLCFTRLQELSNALAEQKINYQNALDQLGLLIDFLNDPSHILGSIKTKHGEIAEHVQVDFSNAEDLVDGKLKSHEILQEGLERFSKADYLRYGKMVQAKVYNSPRNTLKAINMHLNKYPEFLDENGVYDIPKDQFDILKDIYVRGETNRSSLTKTTYGNEETIYKAIKNFETKNNVKFDEKIFPMKANQADVQIGKVDETIIKEKEVINKKNNQSNNKIEQEHQPTMNEGIKATAVAAGAEGATTFAIEFYKMKKEKKEISNFSDEDWIYIFTKSGISVGKGGIRGASLYALTNFTNTPAPVANAMITATFGVVTQTKMLYEDKIDAQDFIDNSELMCLDVSMSTLSTLLGQMMIPIPIVGAIIGNAVGTTMLQISQTYLDDKEKKLLYKYQMKHQLSIDIFKTKQEEQLYLILQKYNKENELLDLMFSKDSNDDNFKYSVELCESFLNNKDYIMGDDDKNLEDFMDSNIPIKLN